MSLHDIGHFQYKFFKKIKKLSINQLLPFSWYVLRNRFLYFYCICNLFVISFSWIRTVINLNIEIQLVNLSIPRSKISNFYISFKIKEFHSTSFENIMERQSLAQNVYERIHECSN